MEFFFLQFKLRRENGALQGRVVNAGKQAYFLDLLNGTGPQFVRGRHDLCIRNGFHRHYVTPGFSLVCL